MWFEGNSLNSLIIPVAVVLLLAILLAVAAAMESRKRRQIIEHARALETAQARSLWAGAEVISVTRLGEYDSTGKAGLHLRMQVSGAGPQPYRAAAVWLVDLPQLAQLQPGARLPVRVDPDDPQRVFPNLSGMRFLAKG
ncbi:MAG: hypothetical protein HPY85_16420 [Anaerolineae bacterium]|nr:hypothetical protein [Anaerolineae bacterium]